MHENEITTKLPKGKSKESVLGSSWFDRTGRITKQGLHSLSSEGLRSKAKEIKCFRQNVYVKRYTGLAKLIKTVEPKSSVKMLTAAIGTAGSFPEYTRKNLKELVKRADYRPLEDSLRHIAWRTAITAHNAYMSEKGGRSVNRPEERRG